MTQGPLCGVTQGILRRAQQRHLANKVAAKRVHAERVKPRVFCPDANQREHVAGSGRLAGFGLLNQAFDHTRDCLLGGLCSTRNTTVTHRRVDTNTQTLADMDVDTVTNTYRRSYIHRYTQTRADTHRHTDIHRHTQIHTDTHRNIKYTATDVITANATNQTSAEEQSLTGNTVAEGGFTTSQQRNGRKLIWLRDFSLGVLGLADSHCAIFLFTKSVTLMLT